MGPSPDLLPSGSLFADRYEIESPLGRGAFAVTYLARDQFRRRRVALKVFSSSSEEVLEAVRTETRVSQALDHPNVVSLLDSGVAGGRPYTASEWVEGASLDMVLQSGPLSLAQTIEACTGIAGALRQAHSHGIIHRDLKPSNVLVPGWPAQPDFRSVRLLDFGVAGALKPSTQATQAGMIFGTPVYMSPEQVLGEPQTTATDIYALGLLLYEMLTGRKLREGKDTVALFRSILDDPAPLLPPSVPAPLARLIGESLRRDPAARPTLDRFDDALRVVPSAPSSRAARRPLWAAVALALAFCAAILLGVLLPAVFGGVFLTIVGVGAGFWIRGRLNRSGSDLKSQALGLAIDARQHVDLSATMALQVTDLVGRLRQIDERILAGTVALMLNEYQRASEGKDRQSALMNVVALSEKLGQRLSPWYVRYKDAIAMLVAVAGAVSGLLTAYNGLRHK